MKNKQKPFTQQEPYGKIGFTKDWNNPVWVEKWVRSYEYAKNNLRNSTIVDNNECFGDKQTVSFEN